MGRSGPSPRSLRGPVPARSAAEAGFTLVEALVALAVAALIGLLLVQAVRGAGALTQLGARIAVEADLATVRDHLRGALSRPRGRGADGRQPPFLGTPEQFAATIAAPIDTERGADLRMVLAAAPRADGGIDLVESRGLDTGAADPPEVLVAGAAALRLRYFGTGQTEMQPRWLDGWTRRDRVPDLVEITLAFPPGDRRRWAPLVIALRGAS
ncbi:hypothetical protein [Methylobacterium sp. JK268]